MYRSQHRRNKDISVQPQPSSTPVVLPSHSQSSLTSLASSDASSSLLPAVSAPDSNSGQFNITSSDHPQPSFPSVTTSKKSFFPLSKSSAPRVPSSLTPDMGQTLSRPAPPPTLASSNESTSSGGNRLKRVWATRRKKSEDVTLLLGGQSPVVISEAAKGKEREASGRTTPSPNTPVTPVDVQRTQLPLRQPKQTKNFLPLQLGSPLSVFSSSRRNSSSPKSPKFSGSAPLPPSAVAVDAFANKKLPLTPPITPSPPLSSSALSFAQSSTASFTTYPHPNGDVSAKADHETKQDWRKSDSTMASRITLRPGAFGNRSPRPVSLAESSHSGHTVVVNKRLSALITDADFAMPEEGVLDHDGATKGTGRPSPTPSLKALHRRSMSLSPGFGLRMKSGSPEPVNGLDSPSLSPPVSPMASARDTPTLTRAAAEGIITPTMAPGSTQSAGSNIRGRLAAWTAASPTPTATPSSTRTGPDRPLPSPQAPPSQARVAPANHPPVSHPPSFRQTTVSMTGSLAPTAAGIALGIGKRAAERVHRVWGGFSSSSTSQSAYSSTSSVDQVSPTSSHGHENAYGGRATPAQAIPSQPAAKSGWRGKRGTPNAPSGTWSVASSTSSISECEALTRPAGPNLGKKIRGAMLNAAGSPVAGGLVFGRQLEICVQQTAIERPPEAASRSAVPGIPSLEDRALPALVTRCAQHLLQWGVQEEGLFRVSGRPAHVAKLRSEFDTGADYSLVDSDPGDLDPHAVASIFKAYLRELPESLLTSALAPRFEAIMTAENTEAEAASSRNGSAPRPGIGSKGPTLPSGPRNGISLRKPPSLSTLAMPNFSSMRTVSPAGLEALTALITLLPPENRDLLFTVTELIIATAAKSKDTKMPLGNLLVVFCPSLNMNPSLLRILCDQKDIWNGPARLPSVSIASPSIALDVDQDKQKETEQQPPDTSAPAARPRPGVTAPRDPLATLYVPNTQSLASMYARSSSNSGSYVSALEGPAEVDTRTSTPLLGSPHRLPPLSSSTDSLATPSTMSEASSFSQPPSLNSHSSGPEQNKKLDLDIPIQPVIVEDADLSLPAAPRRPAISSPVPFPSSSDSSVPHTPLSPRKSFAVLSFPPLRSSEASSPSSASSTSSLGRSRPSRPSLHLLFSKKSTASLKAPSPQERCTSPHSAPALTTNYSPPAPPSTVTSPQSELSVAAPSLATPISSSPMNINFDVSVLKAQVPNDLSDIPPQDTIRLVHVRTDSTTSSLYSTPQETPVADRFRGRLPSVTLSTKPPLAAPEVAAPEEFPRSPSQLSLTPSITLEIGEGDDDDWARSVLIAAGTDEAKTP